MAVPVAFPPHIMALTKVQRLYDACDVVFSSPAAAPTLGDIRWLQNILGQFSWPSSPLWVFAFAFAGE
jgi:cysteamine dioxygenase